ncbi:MAG: ABC transporter substrate-binding protein [Anaerovoracaceae bacterium]
MKKNRAGFLAGVMAVLLLFSCAGCAESRETVTLTMWHVYGGQTDSPLNTLIEEFNSTVGKKEHISIEVTSISNTNTIHEDVLASVNNEAGAAELPDLFISYPKTVLALPDQDILVDYSDYFSEEDLADYIPEFIEEGTINGSFNVFPVAKSTEILFVNKTLFDRFAQATGASMEQMATWEGLFDLTEKYYEWTDAKTPDTAGDGKTFLAHDYLFNYLQVGVESLGEDFFEGDEISFSPTLEKVWNAYAKTAVRGGMWLQEGYATEPLRTGDAIVSIGSSASVLYYKDEVTYPDNTSEPMEIVALPCPVFEGGQKLVMQRGAGFCTVKSTPEKEKAAVTFLKWLTEPECNVRFVTSAGYMPVTRTAFTEGLSGAVDTLSSPKYRSLYETLMKMQPEYSFYTAPQIESYLKLEEATEKYMRTELNKAHSQMAADPAADADALAVQALERFREDMRQVQ